MTPYDKFLKAVKSKSEADIKDAEKSLKGMKDFNMINDHAFNKFMATLSEARLHNIKRED